MPKTLIKSRWQTTKQKKLPPNLQSFKQKLLSGNGFINVIS